MLMWVQFSRLMTRFLPSHDPWQLPRVNAYATAQCARDRSCGAQTLKLSCLVSTRSAGVVSLQSVRTSARTRMYILSFSLMIGLFTCFVHVKEMKSTLFPISGRYPELLYWRWAETLKANDHHLWSLTCCSDYPSSHTHRCADSWMTLLQLWLMHLRLLWRYTDLITSDEINS